ncbi:hypothetical protein NL676_025597 [Syzygium grande]|nr:hypothetical protein NL676_025597 [Syzygium grande]
MLKCQPRLAITVEAAEAMLKIGHCSILGRADANRCHCSTFFPILRPPRFFIFNFCGQSRRTVSPSNPTAMVESPLANLEVRLGVYGQGIARLRVQTGKIEAGQLNNGNPGQGLGSTSMVQHRWLRHDIASRAKEEIERQKMEVREKIISYLGQKRPGHSPWCVRSAKQRR